MFERHWFEMEPVEQRSKVNFTEEERNVLVDLVSRYSSVLKCKQTDAVSVHAKKKAWEKLTEEFNCRHNVRPRTSKQLKKCWENLKEKWRRESREHPGNIQNRRVLYHFLCAEIAAICLLHGKYIDLYLTKTREVIAAANFERRQQQTACDTCARIRNSGEDVNSTPEIILH